MFSCLQRCQVLMGVGGSGGGVVGMNEIIPEISLTVLTALLRGIHRGAGEA